MDNDKKQTPIIFCNHDKQCPGASCSKLTTSLVKVSLKFETKFYEYNIIFVEKMLGSFALETIFTFFQQKTRMMFIKHYAPNRCLCIKVAKSTMCN